MRDKIEYLDFLVCVIIINLFSCHGEISCPPDWIRNGTSCYLLVTTAMTWENAEDYCVGLNSYLAEVSSKFENEVLKNICRAGGGLSYYLGGTDADIEGTFSWVRSKQHFTYTDWFSGEPNDGGGSGQDCVQMLKMFEYKWDDVQCDSLYFSICEFEILTTSTASQTTTEQEDELTSTPAIQTTTEQEDELTSTPAIQTTTERENELMSTLAIQTTAEQKDELTSTPAIQTTTEQEDELTSTPGIQTTAEQENEPTSTSSIQTTTTADTTEMTSLQNRSFPCAENNMYQSHNCCSKHETQEEVKQFILELRTLLLINKTGTSKFKRSLISASDNRPSVIGIGLGGIICMVLVFFIIISFDILRFIRFLLQCRN